MATLTQSQRLKKAVINIMQEPRYAPLAGVLLMGTKEVVDTIPTARTNGVDEQYSRAFIGKLSDPELRFVVLHECLHKVLRHVQLWEILDHKIVANIASDLVINLTLADENEKDNFAVMPKYPTGEPMGYIDPQYRGWDTVQIYKHLMRQPNILNNKDLRDKYGDGLDEHALLPDEYRPSLDGDKDYSKEIDRALRQGMVGNKDAQDRYKDLLKPRVDWRSQLRNWMTARVKGSEYSSWSRPNRRYVSLGLYLPSGETQKAKGLTVAIDTSGSITDQDLAGFLGELVGICNDVQPETIRVLYWDTSVRGDELYTQQQLPNVRNLTRPRGGGGTDPQCVADAISSGVVVVLTDGHVLSWGKWGAGIDVLWCLVGGNKAVPTTGTAIYVG